MAEADSGFYLTNYESVRDGRLDVNLFSVVSLDEADVLRSYGSKTFQTFMDLFQSVRFRLVATATPSPNRFKELIHYAGFLGIMDTGQGIDADFQARQHAGQQPDAVSAQGARILVVAEFGAIFLQRPSDLGHDDTGYDLPPLNVHWHEPPTDHSAAGEDRDGQVLMFRDAAIGVTAAASENATAFRRVSSACCRSCASTRTTTG